MEYTSHANFKKPGYSDTVDINDINENFDAVDTHIGSGVVSSGGAHGIRYDKTDGYFKTYNEETGTWENITPTAGSSMSATSASKLATSRTFRVNLSSTSAVSFNGTANVTPGVTGVLGVQNGGTGKNTALTAADVGAAEASHTHTPSSIGAAAASHTHNYLSLNGGTISGNLALDNGDNYGTKLSFGDGAGDYVYLYEYEDDSLEIHATHNIRLYADDLVKIQSNNIILDGFGTSGVVVSGGATNNACVRNIYAGTGSMTAGSTSLTTGNIYLQYE